MQRLLLTSTFTGKKEPFIPQDPAVVTMYVCGITPYDYAHIGHGRCYVTFDILYRLLRFLGYRVTYCRNVTDIDDKLLNRAERDYGSPFDYTKVANFYTNAFHEDLRKLSCLSPTYEPRVTEHIPAIIAAIGNLVAAGHAYVSEGSVYFRITSYPPYGTLSKQKIDEMRAGARVAVNECKEDPLDFALWKAEAAGTFWESPWGWGRPGWHIECSVLALQLLGKSIDIHGGGMDLLFPHHENERAQSESLTGLPFVRYWLHNAFVRIKQEKMSKSLGNFVTLRDAFSRVDPMVLRYYFMIHHYRNPLDFSWDDIEATQKNYQKLIHILSAARDTTSFEKYRIEEFLGHNDPLLQKMVALLTDDLNVQGCLGLAFEEAAQLRDNPERATLIAAFIRNILGCSLQPIAEKEVVITDEIRQLLQERLEARAQRDWKRADGIRDALAAKGIKVQDDKI